MKTSKTAVWYALAVLFAINTLNFFDRFIIGALSEPIRKEFDLSDASLGLLSTAFVVLYAIVGIPFGRFADTSSRKKILSTGVFAWSLLTAATGIAQSFWQMIALRLGVGVGEASCAPAATSLIGDLFSKAVRGKALSIFMLGLPIGAGLSFAVSGTIAKTYGWRAAFLVAGIPGILFAVAALFIREPVRGASEKSEPGAIATGFLDTGSKNPVAIAPGSDSPYLLILASPTMRWLIVSGVIHNFCLYALSAFITPYLMRYHGLDIRDANFGSMLINGIFTIPGLLFGGVIGDTLKKRRINGGLYVATLAVLFSIPLFLLANMAGPQNTDLFVLAMGGGFALMYFYYANIYSTIQDITEPSLRGTAMSVYFLAMYLLGGAFGPYIFGWLSDYFTKRMAAASGVSDLTQAAIEPFKAAGLHSAMYIVPVLCIVLAAVLFAASRAVKKEQA